jgi:hypothetical protein
MVHKLLVAVLLSLGLSGCTPLTELPQIDDTIEIVRLDEDYQLIPQTVESKRLIRADQVSYTGRGINILLIDTFYREKGSNHGQWTYGIIKAIAPDSVVWDCHVRFKKGMEKPKTKKGEKYVYQCLQEALSRSYIRVINMSFGEGKYADPCPNYDLLGSPLLSQLQAKGVVLVASSGNDGWINAMRAPACHPNVISVGATWDQTFVGQFYFKDSNCTDLNPNADKVTCYTNQAYFLDVVAPGSKVDGSSGTSASAPIVSAVAALMLEANPSLTPDQIRSYLRSSGVPVTDQGNPGSGLTHYRVDAYNAVQLALGGSVFIPPPTPQPPPYVPPPPAPPPSIPAPPPPVETPWQTIRFGSITDIKEGNWVYWRFYISQGDFEVISFTTFREDEKKGEAWLLSEDEYASWELNLPVRGWRWYSGEVGRAVGVTQGWYYLVIYNRRDWDGEADPLKYFLIHARYR